LAQFFSPCPRGLENVLAQELETLGALEIHATDGGVAFRGEFNLCYRVNLESRIASRVLWQVSSARYRSENDVYHAAHALRWMDWFEVKRSIMVKVSARHCPLKSIDFVTLRIKDAICDRFRKDCGERPDVDTKRPHFRIYAYLDAERVTLYIDTSGEALFKRGYREGRLEAPIRENLAAGIVKLTGWQPGEALLDPMCGSATFLIEAALMALRIAPGARRAFAFTKLKRFSTQEWDKLKAESARRHMPVKAIGVFGSDFSAEALVAARANIEAAGVSGAIELAQTDVLSVSAPFPTGVIVTNPPYGVRVGEEEALRELYPKLGDALKQRFAGWRAYLFSGDTQLPKLIRLQASKRTPLFNGRLECRLYEYVVQQGSMRRVKGDGVDRLLPLASGVGEKGSKGSNGPA
jgi:putative N6-adenine-specific DNA methylase